MLLSKAATGLVLVFCGTASATELPIATQKAVSIVREL